MSCRVATQAQELDGQRLRVIGVMHLQHAIHPTILTHPGGLQLPTLQRTMSFVFGNRAKWIVKFIQVVTLSNHFLMFGPVPLDIGSCTIPVFLLPFASLLSLALCTIWVVPILARPIDVKVLDWFPLTTLQTHFTVQLRAI
jgi:hypothetical protein